MGNGPVIRNPTPSWLRPENASVFDSGVEKALRILASLIGADDPSGQVMGIAAPVDVPGGSGSPVVKAIEAISSKAKKGIKAFHGSPHDFDKFSLSKIGTGEGAQAYGHGLYFAEAPETAGFYKDFLAKKADTPEYWESVKDRVPEFLGVGEQDELFKLKQKLAKNATNGPPLTAQESERFAALNGRYREYHEAVDALKPKGRMYEVSINADPEDFLDWDAPLSQQPEGVRYVMGHATKPTDAEVDAMFALAKQRGVEPTSMPEYKALEARMDEAAKLDRDYPSGRDVYNQFMNDGRDVAIRHQRHADTTLPKAQAEASKQLRDMGIPGIKYLDGASRSAGQGSRNYVVFDDKLIEIRRKYGFMLPIMGAAGFEQWSRQKAAEETGVNPMDALAERKW